jgi:hypothetical protein
VRRLTSIAYALLLGGAGTTLIGLSVLVAGLSARQAVRAAPLPLHPWGAAAGLLAFPLGVLCWQVARRRLDHVQPDGFAAWRLRELT